MAHQTIDWKFIGRGVSIRGIAMLSRDLGIHDNRMTQLPAYHSIFVIDTYQKIKIFQDYNISFTLVTDNYKLAKNYSRDSLCLILAHTEEDHDRIANIGCHARGIFNNKRGGVAKIHFSARYPDIEDENGWNFGAIDRMITRDCILIDEIASYLDVPPQKLLKYYYEKKYK